MQNAEDDVLAKEDEERLDIALAKVQRQNRMGIPGATPDALAHLETDQLSRQKTTKFREEQTKYEQRQRQRTLDAAQLAAAPEPEADLVLDLGWVNPKRDLPSFKVIFVNF